MLTSITTSWLDLDEKSEKKWRNETSLKTSNSSNNKRQCMTTCYSTKGAAHSDQTMEDTTSRKTSTRNIGTHAMNKGTFTQLKPDQTSRMLNALIATRRDITRAAVRNHSGKRLSTPSSTLELGNQKFLSRTPDQDLVRERSTRSLDSRKMILKCLPQCMPHLDLLEQTLDQVSQDQLNPSTPPRFRPDSQSKSPKDIVQKSRPGAALCSMGFILMD